MTNPNLNNLPMNPKTPELKRLLTVLRRRPGLQWLVGLATLCSISTVQAQGFQTDTWTGGGTDNTWGNAANWGGTGVTTEGDDLIFAGTVRLFNTNNFTGLNLDSITFNSGGFDLVGNALTITNGITDNAGFCTNTIPLTLGAPQTFQNTVGGTTDIISGTIALGTNNLTIGGGGDLFLNGVISSANGGTVTVNNSGIARLTAANLFGTNVQDAVTIAGGTLQLGIATGIPTGASVGNLMDNGVLDLNGFSPTINGLEGAGTVDNVPTTLTGTYTLTVGNASSNAVFSGAIQNSSGSLALTKTGFGTETLNGNNTYSGLTTVSQGTLAVGPSGSLGLTSSRMVISPGAVLDVSALNPYGGYYPQLTFNLNAGTPTKPYTNFFGSYNTNYPTFVISTNYTGGTTNIVTNSIVNVINDDINGSFSLYGGSFTPVAPSPGYATFTVNGNLTLDNSISSPNTLYFLLNNITNAGGGVNDLIVVTNGTLNIGDNVNIVISPAAGSLASGEYTLIQSTNYVPGGDKNGSSPPTFTVIAPRGITGVIDTNSQPGNILLQASGTATPASITWAATSAANDNWDIHLTQNWKNNGNPDYFYSEDNVTFDDTGFGTINLTGPLTPGSITFNNKNTNYTFVANAAGLISGSGGITVNGGGSVTLNNPNSFTGNTIINNGTLIMGNYGGYGNEMLYNGVAPGQLIFGTGNGIFEENDSVANVSQVQNFAGLTLQPGANGQIYAPARGANDLGIITFGANINRSVGSTLYMNFTLKANVDDNGVYFTNTIPMTNGLLLGGWAHDGSDWVAAATNYPNASPVSGNYNYTGYSNNTAIATWVSTNNMSVSNTSFSVSSSATINTLKLSGPATVTITAGKTLAIQTGGLLDSSASTGASTITGGTLEGAPGADLILLQNYTSPLTIGSVIADNTSPTALTVGGLGGTVVLTGTNSYTGVTYINGGILQVGAGNTSGSIATSSGIMDNGTLTFDRPDSTSVGAISGLGSLQQSGSGTLTLNANNTLEGLVTISAGKVQVGNGGTTGSISNTVGVANSATLVFDNSGSLGYNGVISGIGSLVQAGTGTLILGTNETYSGGTTVSNGVLALSAAGSISNTTFITVDAGAVFDASAAGGLTLRSAVPAEILDGSGTINGTVTTAEGAKISPGTNGVIGTLTFNNDLDLDGGSVVFDVGNAASDRILVGGTLNMNSGDIIIDVSGSTLANGLYPLIYATNGVAGTLANLVAVGFVQSGQLAVLTNSTANELDLLVYSGFAPTLTWQGDGSQNLWDTSASSLWTSGGVSTLFQNGDNVIFNDSGSASPAVNIDAVVFPGLVTVNSTNENYTLGSTGGSSGRISGGSSLVKNGPGTLTLQTVNDYSGNTAINGGVVQLNGDGGVNDDGMIGSGGNVTNNGTLIANNANTETLAGNLVGTGSLIQEGVGTLILAGNNTGYAGPITLTNILQVGNGVSGTLGSGPVTNNGTLAFDYATPSALTVSANITGSGNITNFGSGTVTLSGTGTYAGSTVVSAGTLRVGAAGALPNGPIILNTGSGSAGTLDMNGFNLTTASLFGTNTGTGTSTFTPSYIVNNGSGTVTLTVNGGTTNTYYGVIADNNNSGSGKVALAVLNGSSLTLNSTTNNVFVSVANTFSGGITVSNATLALGNNYGAIMEAGNEDNEGTYTAGTGPITMEGTNAVLYACGSGGSTSPTLNTVPTAIVLPAGQTATIYGPQRGEFGGTLTGAGLLNYLPNYVRSRMEGNWSAFTGTVIFKSASSGGGNLGIDNAAGMPNAAVIMSVSNAATLSIAGTVAGNAYSIGSLSGGDNTVQLAGGSNPSGDGTASTIWTIGGLNTNTTFGGEITDAGCGIRKVGSGTLTLTNTTLSYGAQTVVSNGTLVFAPSVNSTNFNALVNSSTYLVSTNYTLVAPGILDLSAVGGTLYLGHTAAQTLYGNGTLNGNLVVTNGTVAPGRLASQAGNYTGNSLIVNDAVTLLSGSTVVLGINRTNLPTHDSLSAVSIAYGGTLIVTNFGDTAFPNNSTNVFQLFNGAVSGSFASIILPALPTNEYWVTNLSAGSIALVNTSPALNPNPTNIVFSVSGNTLTLSWPADHTGWYLQVQTNSLSSGLSNNWVDVPNSQLINSTNLTINPTNPTVFYRMSLNP